MNTAGVQHNASFWVHLFITLLAWVGPFLFTWWLLALAFAVVLLQYKVLNKCVMNAGHGIDESKGDTFYSYLFTRMGIGHDKQKVKRVVRGWLYPMLALLAWAWQDLGGFQPLLF